MPRRRLRAYLERDRTYIAYVGLPLRAPKQWKRVERIEADDVLLQGNGRVPVDSVRSFVVAYENGEVLDGERTFQPLPDNVHSIGCADAHVEHTLDPSLLKDGNSYARVENSTPRRGQDGNWHYATKLKNVSAEPIRVVKFGAYKRRWWRWQLSTINGAFFSANEFQAWYGLGERKWLAPEEEVEDPDNYGGPPVIWAFFCVTQSGIGFVAGSLLQ